jgi:hypothetical protein
MEVVKKTILQALTTGATTGCENCAIIIPDESVSYNIKIGLTCEAHDFGFFDAFEDTENMTSANEYSGYGLGTPYGNSDLFVATVEPVGIDNLNDRYLYYGYNIY